MNSCYYFLFLLILKISYCLVPQLCSGVDENAVGNCAELVFAPIDASFSDDAPILPSGFRIIPLDSGMVSLYCMRYDITKYV